MLSRRIPMLAILAASTLSLAAVAAKAGAPCVGQCYEKVATPPSVGVVEEQVMVSSGRIVAYQTPAQFAVVPNPKTIIPEHIVARYAPAKFATVTEEVMISPPGKRWEVTRDASGREIGCWVETPAKFVTRQRSVMIKPPVTLYHRVRQVVDMQPQYVMVRPPEISRETIPPVYRMRTRKVVTPGGVEWRPINSRI